MLIAPIIESIKELFAKITGLDQELKLQKREIASIKAENTEIKKALCDLGKKVFCKK